MTTFNEKLKKARKIMRDHIKTAESAGNIREAETSRRVDNVLCLLCGYDPYEHLSREKRVRKGVSDSMDFVIVLPPKKDVRLIVEVKSISRGLSANMYNQVQNYALRANCEWTLLTDGKEWQLLHVDIPGNRDVEVVYKWDILDDTPAELEKHFFRISLDSIKKGRLAKEWKKRRSLLPKTLAEVLVSERVITAIRRELKGRGFFAPEPIDLHVALANDLLQPEHGIVAKRAYNPDSKTPGRKAAETRRKREQEKTRESTDTPPPPQTE